MKVTLCRDLLKAACADYGSYICIQLKTEQPSAIKHQIIYKKSLFLIKDKQREIIWNFILL